MENLNEKTFVVEEGKQKYTFRAKRMTCTQFLALETILNFSDFENSDHMFKTILEHMEVEANGVWSPVKQKDVEVYIPVSLTQNLRLMYKVCMTFINEILGPAFQKSTESNN